MTEHLRVGVIGVGHLGKFHTEKFANMENVELVGVVDTDKDVADAIAKKFNTKAFYRHTDLLGKVDAVSIVVPTPYHFDVGKAFLNDQVHLFIEKPMTTTLEQADELIRLAEAQNRLIQVGHIERFNPAVVALKDIVAGPRFIESHRLSRYHERGTDVSVVLDLMIHDIDMISYLVKSEIHHIHAAGIPVVSNQVDIANARLEFKNGCVANVTASRIANKNQRKIRIFQQNAYLSVDFANHEISVIQPTDKTGKPEQGDTVLPGMTSRQLHFDKGDALRDELLAFVASIRSQTPPLVTGPVGREALAIALLVMEQINSPAHRFME